MKQFLVFLIVLAAAAGGWFARDLIPKHETKEKENEASAHEKKPVEVENGLVKLDEETGHRLGIETKELEAFEFAARIEGIGRVLDPAPLVALDQEIAAAQAAVDAARLEAQRARTLFQTGENVARKNVDIAEAQLRADELKLDALRKRLPLEWGALIAPLDDAARHALVENLVHGKSVIVRVETLNAETNTAPPSGVSVKLLSEGAPSIASTHIANAPSVDARTQSTAFLLQIDSAEKSNLTPGAAVMAELKTAAETKKGVLLPRSAIVRVGSQAWVYFEKEEREFARLPVPLDARTDEGWFVGEGEDLKAGAKLVITGAQALLSTELNAGASEE